MLWTAGTAWPQVLLKDPLPKNMAESSRTGHLISFSGLSMHAQTLTNILTFSHMWKKKSRDNECELGNHIAGPINVYLLVPHHYSYTVNPSLPNFAWSEHWWLCGRILAFLLLLSFHCSCHYHMFFLFSFLCF